MCDRVYSNNMYVTDNVLLKHTDTSELWQYSTTPIHHQAQKIGN